MRFGSSPEACPRSRRTTPGFFYAGAFPIVFHTSSIVEPIRDVTSAPVSPGALGIVVALAIVAALWWRIGRARLAVAEPARSTAVATATSAKAVEQAYACD